MDVCAKLTIPERQLKDLRVVDKHLTLEQLAEPACLNLRWEIRNR